MYKRIKNTRKYKARFKGVIIVGMHIKYKCCRTTELTNEMTNEMSNEMSNEMTNEMSNEKTIEMSNEKTNEMSNEKTNEMSSEKTNEMLLYYVFFSNENEPPKKQHFYNSNI